MEDQMYMRSANRHVLVVTCSVFLSRLQMRILKRSSAVVFALGVLAECVRRSACDSRELTHGGAASRRAACGRAYIRW
jgi:hypothetical protein